MSIKRERRKHERTPEEQARIDAIRKKYQGQKPGPDQLIASGEYEGPVQAAAYWEVRRVMAELKAERERQGLTLAELAERSGIDKGAISKLETGRQVNPTIDTLARIAAGLGIKVGLTFQREGETATGTGKAVSYDPPGKQTPPQDAPQDASKAFYNAMFWAQAQGARGNLDELLPMFDVDELLPRFLNLDAESKVFTKAILDQLVSHRRLAVAEHLRLVQAEWQYLPRAIMDAVNALHTPVVKEMGEGKSEKKADEPRSRRFGRRQD